MVTLARTAAWTTYKLSPSDLVYIELSGLFVGKFLRRLVAQITTVASVTVAGIQKVLSTFLLCHPVWHPSPLTAPLSYPLPEKWLRVISEWSKPLSLWPSQAMDVFFSTYFSSWEGRYSNAPQYHPGTHRISCYPHTVSTTPRVFLKIEIDIRKLIGSYSCHSIIHFISLYIAVMFY